MFKKVKLPRKIGDWFLTDGALLGKKYMYKNAHSGHVAELGALLEEQNVMQTEGNVMTGEFSGLGKEGKNTQIIGDMLTKLGKTIRGDADAHEPIPIQNVLLIAGGAWLAWHLLKRGLKD